MAMVNVADGGGKSVSINKVVNNVKKPAVQPISKTVIKTPPININDKLRNGGVTTGGGNTSAIKNTANNIKSTITSTATNATNKAKVAMVQNNANNVTNNIKNTLSSGLKGNTTTSSNTKTNLFDKFKDDPSAGIVGGGSRVPPQNSLDKFEKTPASLQEKLKVATGCIGVTNYLNNANNAKEPKTTKKDFERMVGFSQNSTPSHSSTFASTGCGGVKNSGTLVKEAFEKNKETIKNKKVEIPLKTSDGKKLSKKATGFLKDGAAIVASGALAGPAGVAVATTVVAGKTLVANAPALRENANKAKQIAQDLLSGLKKSQQTLDTLHEKWQGSDASKYIESTKVKLQNLEIISQVMELYQKTSEQAARKVEETQQSVSQFVDNIRNN